MDSAIHDVVAACVVFASAVLAFFSILWAYLKFMESHPNCLEGAYRRITSGYRSLKNKDPPLNDDQVDVEHRGKDAQCSEETRPLLPEKGTMAGHGVLDIDLSQGD